MFLTGKEGILSQEQVQRHQVYRKTRRHGRIIAIAIVAVILFLAAVLLPIFNIAADNLVLNNCKGCVEVKGSLTYLLFQCGEVHESGMVPDPTYNGRTFGGYLLPYTKYTFSCLGPGL